MRRGVDYSGMFRYFQQRLEQSHWSHLDSAINIFFAVVLISGIVFFIFTQMANVEPRGAFSRYLFPLFFTTGISYLFWFNDLVFGLPFGWSRYQIVPVLMGAGLAYFLIAGSVTFWQEKSKPIAEGYKRCPKCKAIILKLVVECPECGKKI